MDGTTSSGIWLHERTPGADVKHELAVGTARAAKGTRATGAIRIGTHAGGGSIEIPVILINGDEDGSVLWIDGAIHGDEPEGPHSVLKLMARIDPSNLRGAVVGIPVMNVAGFEATQRGNPTDPFAYDMARIYPGRPEGYLSERIAYAHFTAMVEIADMEISVHSGGIGYYLGYIQFFAPTPAGLELAKAMGPRWDVLLRSSSDGGTLGAMKQRGKAAITIEMGGFCETFPTRFRSNVDVLVSSFLNVMRHFKMIDGTPEYATRWFIGQQKMQILAPASGLWEVEPEVIRQRVHEGDRLGRIYSLHGDVVADIRAPFDGIPHGVRTNPYVQLGDWCIFYGVIDEELTE